MAKTDDKVTEAKKEIENVVDEKPNNDHPLFGVLKSSKAENVIEDIRNYFEVDNVSVEIMDSSGMTPLMHACWKGNVDLVKFLIKLVRLLNNSNSSFSKSRY